MEREPAGTIAVVMRSVVLVTLLFATVSGLPTPEFARSRVPSALGSTPRGDPMPGDRRLHVDVFYFELEGDGTRRELESFTWQ